MKHKPCLLSLALSLFASASAYAAMNVESCDSNPVLQAKQSIELKKIAAEDQKDRSGPYESADWAKINHRDLERRVRVASIFAAGCFMNADDYANAALVFQHGDVPDQYFQAFIWAAKAVKLGDESQRWLTAAALDRYLVHSGQMQLFGTQFAKDSKDQWCIEPIEKSFPESRRFAYLKKNLRESTAAFLKFYNSTQSPDDIHDCEHSLKESPQGSVPGFW